MTILIHHPVFKFDIEFNITDEKLSGTRKTNCFRAHGYVEEAYKFNGVAHFDKKTSKFIEIKNIKDIFDRDWILDNAIEVIEKYDPGVLTIRGLHYQLVNLGMINHMRLYKRVVSAMVDARRDGEIDYNTFSDHDRSMSSSTDYEKTDVDAEIEVAKREIKNWMTNYYKNYWENQDYYLEVFIEKKALLGSFSAVCDENHIGLGACKGYPSLTFLYKTSRRMKEAVKIGKTPVILYFGDYDPSGEDIPRSIQDNLLNDFGVDVKVDRIALMEEQVKAWNLPPAPAKSTDSRTANWDGIGQVELDAVLPEQIRELCQDAIDRYFDDSKHDELKETEKEEKSIYQEQLKDFVNNLSNDE